MSLTQERIERLNALCLQFRKDLIQTLYTVQTGHPGGSLSVCEILSVIYFENANIHVQNLNSRSRDKEGLCK